jgi:hypothetical protein
MYLQRVIIDFSLPTPMYLQRVIIDFSLPTPMYLQRVISDVLCFLQLPRVRMMMTVKESTIITSTVVYTTTVNGSVVTMTSVTAKQTNFSTGCDVLVDKIKKYNQTNDLFS